MPSNRGANNDNFCPGLKLAIGSLLGIFIHSKLHHNITSGEISTSIQLLSWSNQAFATLVEAEDSHGLV